MPSEWPEKIMLETRKGQHGGPPFLYRSEVRRTPYYAGQELHSYVPASRLEEAVEAISSAHTRIELARAEAPPDDFEDEVARAAEEIRSVIQAAKGSEE